MLRTHTCGELRKDDVGKQVSLCGWVQTRRDHGGIIFIDLRDRYGLTQVVFDPEHNKNAHQEADKLRREWCIKATGKIRPRKEGMINEKMPTGEIEIITDTIEILNESDVPPIEVDDNKVAGEEMRLKYRYLDLRRPQMQYHLEMRHKVKAAIMQFMDKEGFLNIETPLLLKPTPEGARDFLVPSRINPGKFYALPQSPQLYKQTLMVSGCDKYYQMAPCLRDEDLRADRQFEFIQMDMEMSFVEQQDIIDIISKQMQFVFKQVLEMDLKLPFLKLSYKDAMNRFGIDKPDLRFGLELIDVTDIAKHSDFTVFKSAIDKKGVVKCINAKGSAKYSRKELDELIAHSQRHGAKGMAWAKITNEGKMESSIVKYFNDEVQENFIKKTEAAPGDLLLFVADSWEKTCNALAHVRLMIGEKENLIQKDEFQFCWITDFPLFEWNEDEQKWDPMHHPFSMPKAEDQKYLETNPEKVHATLYDLVLNGVELGSGSIRIHKPEIQQKVLKVIGMDWEIVKEKFGFLIDSFSYGAPPHGGIALGFDRVVALLTKNTDIREVIAFPKNKQGINPMDGCPIAPEAADLKALHIKTEIIKKENK